MNIFHESKRKRGEIQKFKQFNAEKLIWTHCKVGSRRRHEKNLTFYAQKV